MTKTDDLRQTAPQDLPEQGAVCELAALAVEILAHDAAYHGSDAPVISDAAYDALKRRNLAIEQRFPHLVREDSPSHRVGYAPLEKFEQIAHPVPMLSLKNAMSADDARDFMKSARNF